MPPTADDERRHPPGPELGWAESWAFDFVSGDGWTGGWARILLLPNRGVAWYHGYVTGPGRHLVAVADTAVAIPERDLEVRSEGLWATHICETPLDHWTIGLEAFAVGLDNPADMYGRQYGDQVPLGFDLEWEAVVAPDVGLGRHPTADGYQQVCRVSGEVLVGSEKIDLDGFGFRDHRWGVMTDWDHRWFDVRGRLDDGTLFGASVVDGDLAAATGTVDGRSASVEHLSRRVGTFGLLDSARVVLGDLSLSLESAGVTPVEVTDPEGRRTRTPRAMCIVVTGDYRMGHAWVTVNEPQLD